MQKTVFLCIPTYVFTSDFLRTRYLEYLSQEYRVVVLTPMIGEREARLGGYLESPNVSFVKFSSANERFWQFFKFLRVSLVNEFDYLSAVQFFYRRPNYRNNWKRRLLRFFGRPLARFLTADFFTGVEKLLLRSSDKFQSYLRAYEPSVLITATPGFDSWEAELIILAKRAGLPTVAANFTWDNLTTNCKHVRKTDYLIAWNEVVKDEAVNIHHYKPDRVFVSGGLRFDHYFRDEPDEPQREKFLVSKNLDPRRKTLVFATLTRNYREQVEHLRQIIDLSKRGRFIEPLNILARIHPLDTLEFYREFIGLTGVCVEQGGKEVVFDQTSRNRLEMNWADLLNLKYTLKYSDVHINYGSTLCLEAAVFDKPTVTISFLKTSLHEESAKYLNHYLNIINMGAVRVGNTMDEVVTLVNNYLKDPALDKQARKRLTSTYMPFGDGLAYKRSVGFLADVISSHAQL